jgi:hypothetical protein
MSFENNQNLVNDYEIINNYLSYKNNYIVYPDEKSATNNLKNYKSKNGDGVFLYIQNTTDKELIDIYQYSNNILTQITTPFSFITKKSADKPLCYYININNKEDLYEEKYIEIVNNSAGDYTIKLKKEFYEGQEGGNGSIIDTLYKYFYNNNDDNNTVIKTIVPSDRLLQKVLHENYDEESLELIVQYLKEIKPIFDLLKNKSIKPEKEIILLVLLLYIYTEVNNDDDIYKIYNIFFTNLLDLTYPLIKEYIISDSKN